jgi:hypothetical protein
MTMGIGKKEASIPEIFNSLKFTNSLNIGALLE